MFTIQQLKYVLDVVKWGSISEAARRSFITQPALSSSIKELEEITGITIFSRTKKGTSLTPEGAEFVAHARQLVHQTELLADRYTKNKPPKQYFSVSSQHYTFATEAFVKLIQWFPGQNYEWSFHETRTFEVIANIKNMVSELGLLYLSDFNQAAITKLFKENGLLFQTLLKVHPQVLVNRSNPLAKKKILTLGDLSDYPYVYYEQGDYNSLYFSEEYICAISSQKHIKTNDRAALLNIINATNAFTIFTGIVSEKLNGLQFTSIPLAVEDHIEIGLVTLRKAKLSPIAEKYIEFLKQVLKDTLARSKALKSSKALRL